jgi:hypothetical protein
MANLNFAQSLSGGSIQISRSSVRTADGLNGRDPILPVGQAGALTTRVDNDEGTITAASAGHGIETADVVDVYWDGGVQYGCVVGTVAGTAIPITGGDGDNLPVEATAVVVTKQVQVNATIDGDNLVILGIVAQYTAANSPAVAHVDMQDATDAQIVAVKLQANEPQFYDIAGGTASNIFTGDPIKKVMASNGSATEPALLKILWLVDSTP